MDYELALIAVLVAGGYWGWFFARQQLTRTYGLMQIACALLCGVELICRRMDLTGFGPLGAIGVGGGVMLLVVGPLTRGLARRAAASERFRLAEKLLDVAEVLTPGAGVGDEKALLGAMREIRDGNIEQTVGALEAAKQRAPAEARLAIDERIAMLYLASYRWQDAIAHAEENLFAALPPLSEPQAGPPQVALRRALGVAPPVWVELLGAYGYQGDLDQAARMLARLEDVCAGREDAAIWVHRGRLIFLALAGRVDAVQALVEPRLSPHMSRAARTYWVGVAHERKGESSAAEAAYEKARARSRGRPRLLIDQALARLAEAKPLDLGPTAIELVQRVEAAEPPRVVERPRPRGPVATRTLTFALLAVAAVIAIALGDSSDVGVLMRGGAMVRGLIREGEWWRLVSSVFVHVGAVHLVLNATGLWFVGRLVEDVFGPWRTAAVFGLAGIVGMVASFLASDAGVSAGASGAIFGLLGAMFIELTWQRKHHRAMWSRGVWGSIAVVTVAQVGIGFLYPVTDQWAHGGGLVTGLVAGVIFSPNARWHAAGLHAARAVTVAFAVVVIAAGALVSHTSIGDSLASPTQVVHRSSVFTAHAPATWRADKDDVYDPDLYIVVSAERPAAGTPLAAALADFVAHAPAHARERGFDEVEPATERLVPLPAGWDGSELVISVADPLGGRQRYRLVVAGRADLAGSMLATLYVPETVAREAPAYFTDLLASVRLVP